MNAPVLAKCKSAGSAGAFFSKNSDAPSAFAFRRGVTLLELLIVLTLIASLMGIGVGIFGQLNFGTQTTVGIVKNLLRSARNSALVSGAPARVVIDRQSKSLRTVQMRPIGLWHFETPDGDGAFSIRAISHDVEFDKDGRLGACARFASSKEQFLELPVAGMSSYSSSGGFGIDFDANFDRLSHSLILERKGSFALSVTAEGRLKGEVYVEGTAIEGGGRNIAETREGSLQALRWHHISFVYDQKRIQIFIDGVEEAGVEETGALRVTSEPILLGSSQLGFQGRIDELKISAVATGEEVAMPKGVDFVAGINEVQFDAQGNLDVFLHPEPVQIGIQFDNGKKASVEVGVYGTIR